MADRRLEDQLEGIHVERELEEEGSKAKTKLGKINLSRPGRT